jgi:glycosyltransferase involved in cell wall biosynthesis
MNQTKILYCIDSLIRGGTELQLLGLIERLDRGQFQPHLLTIRPGDDGLHPVDCPHLEWMVPKLMSAGGISATVRLARYLRRHQFSLVQTFFQDSTVLGGIAARLACVPVRLVSFRDLGFWRTPAQEMLLRRVYPGMTGFLCNSDTIREHVLERERLEPSHIKVIRNGVDPQVLAWVDHTGPTRNVGIVGNLTRHVKRTDLFLRAAAIVARKHPEISWHVIGDGHLRPQLEALAAAEGIAAKVVFAGRIKDITGYLARLEIGVICSDSEGLSNALLEYMFLGVTAVATDVGGNRELIDRDKTGLLVPPDDAEGLAAALTRCIESTALRRALASAARRAVEINYNWERCVDAHMMVYKEALGR